jgi:hypothetical protein
MERRREGERKIEEERRMKRERRSGNILRKKREIERVKERRGT